MTNLIKTQIPKDLLQLALIFNKNSYEFYLVGGCVRDLLMNIKPNDYDVTTNAKPNEIIAILKENNIDYHTVGIEYGTVTAIINKEEYEITTYRSETNYTNRRPETVQFETSLEKDLSRRDFTINAMAYDPINEEIIDPHNGQNDIKQGLIVCIGNPKEKFIDDPLRILRAIRFSIKYDFLIEENTSFYIHDNVKLLQQLSKERITEEYKKIFSYNKPITKHFMNYSDVIFECIPELKPCYKFEQKNKYHWHDVYAHCLYVTDLCHTTKFEIKMAALLHDIGKPDSFSLDSNGYGHFYGHPKKSKEITEMVLKNNFKLTTKEFDLISDLVEHHDMLVSNSKKSVKRILNKFSFEFLKDWAILKKADRVDHVNFDFSTVPNIDDFLLTAEEIIKEGLCFSLKDLAVNGNDIIINFHLKPGKQIGIILNNLLEAVINEEIENEKEILLEKAKNFIE